ncbi:AAA family ATPase [Bacillus cereus]|uniref:AAA family ATPase n=1 Tax=Bacillus sp. RB3 TaxID=3050012 RepID=UPI00254140E9|nr:AAA family ATPase [Bacillus sp. RB3]MDK3011616.1 AAA family ATPase [Bacillus sp. RB3]MDZ4439045.1 AAA family ATPase [Bacillus cereus]
MNGDLLKRLFRTISSGDQEDIVKMAKLIIDYEEKRGHQRLSKELGEIIKDTPINTPYQEKNLSSLPRSRRYDIPLATYIEIDKLEYEMVLPFNVEQRLDRIEKEYAARGRLALYGLQPKKKILLYGPPGCGKTLGAQRLAHNTGLPFVKVRFDAVLSAYLGETSANLRTMFEIAEKSPCLLFIDEFDSFAISRTSNNEVGEIKRIVNSFLQLLDEYNGDGLLVAATNLDQQLDPAVWRRFDDVIEIPKPGEDEIRELIMKGLVNMEIGYIDWDIILKATKGFSAAQVIRASREAAKTSILEGKYIVTHELLLEAVNNTRGE